MCYRCKHALFCSFFQSWPVTNVIAYQIKNRHWWHWWKCAGFTLHMLLYVITFVTPATNVFPDNWGTTMLHCEVAWSHIGLCQCTIEWTRSLRLSVPSHSITLWPPCSTTLGKSLYLSLLRPWLSKNIAKTWLQRRCMWLQRGDSVVEFLFHVVSSLIPFNNAIASL